MLKIAQISDLHYRRSYDALKSPYLPVLSKMTSPFEQLKCLFDQEDNNYDLIIISGDICEFGDIDDYEDVKKFIYDYFHCDFIVTSGNHDCRHNLNKVFFEEDSDGPIFDIWKNKGWKVISVDSSDINHQNGVILNSSAKKMNEELKEEIPTIIFTHHHLLDGQFNLPKAEGSEKIIKATKKDHVKCVLTGHTHHYFCTSVDSTILCTCGSLTFVADFDLDGRLVFFQRPSANIYEIEDDRIIIRQLSNKAAERQLCVINI